MVHTQHTHSLSNANKHGIPWYRTKEKSPRFLASSSKKQAFRRTAMA